jgi:type III restriction enzyme
MAVEMIDLQQIPQSSFVRRSAILSSKEYREAVAALPTIKPGKAVRVTLSPETQASAKNAAFALKRHLVGEVVTGFADFDLDLRGIHQQPVAENILVAHLHKQEQFRLISGNGIVPEKRLEDYLIRGLIDQDDICYDDHAELLYKLAGQVVQHLQTYLKDEDEVRNVLQYHQAQLVSTIHSQMQGHYTQTAIAYEAITTRGFTTLRPNNYSLPAGETPRNFRVPVDDKQAIRGMLFGGFAKCLYAVQRFQSDPERRFAAVLENDSQVLKWFKPGRGDFQILYRGDKPYEPDFVAETKDAKLICEPKAANEIDDEEVREKAKAAVVWCENATKHAAENGGKP